jgi:integrase
MTYQHYAPFVEFLFLTSCRPSDEIRLQWKHITDDFSYVSFFAGSITTSDSSRLIRVEGSKNNLKRKFPCSNKLKAMLRSSKPRNADADALVFPIPKGKAITYNNFCNNAWNKIGDPIKPGFNLNSPQEDGNKTNR